ncbi:MAG: DUF4365 domain-containing protein [Saprospiraceae bacterium]
MKEEQIKEQLSLHFIGAIASFKNIKVVKPFEDNGVDLLLKKVKVISFKEKIRYLDSGDIIAVQVKSTTKKGIIESENKIKFDLSVKNYNDLIFRKIELALKKVGNVPLILILVVLPINVSKWLEVNQKEDFIKLGGKAYWYYPTKNHEYSKNEYSQRIEIPKENEVDLDFFSNIFNLF